MRGLCRHDLVVPLFLLIAQQRGACVFANDTPHLKVLSELYDRCHETLEQYAAFCVSSITPAEYAGLMPPVSELCSEYHLEPEVAFFICRPAIAHYDTPAAKKEGAPTAAAAAAALDPNSIQPVLPPPAWDFLSPKLYSTFWSHSLYDLFVPAERYDAERRPPLGRTLSHRPLASPTLSYHPLLQVRRRGQAAAQAD